MGYKCGCYYGSTHYNFDDFIDVGGGYCECPRCARVFEFNEPPYREIGEPYATGDNIDFAEEFDFIKRERRRQEENGEDY